MASSPAVVVAPAVVVVVSLMVVVVAWDVVKVVAVRLQQQGRMHLRVM
jgi:hypothetical protein